MNGAGLQRSKIEPSLYFGPNHMLVIVHVDDFLVTGRETDVDELFETLSTTLRVRVEGRLDKTGDEAKLLAQVVKKTDYGFVLETETKTLDQLIIELELQNAKPVATPAIRYDQKVFDENQEELNVEAADLYRRATGMQMWIALRRPDMQFASKECAKGLSSPCELDMMKLKRSARYLKGAPRAIWRFELQTMPRSLLGCVDTDWAGDQKDRRSTSGGVIEFGSSTTSTWSRSQKSVSLSSAESEYYGIVSGIVEARGQQSLLKELGVEVTLRIRTDSSAAKCFSSKPGLGKMKHIQMRHLFVKDLVKAGIVVLEKIKGTENSANLLTKPVTTMQLSQDLSFMKGYRVQSKSSSELEVSLTQIFMIEADESIESLNDMNGVDSDLSDDRFVISLITCVACLVGLGAGQIISAICQLIKNCCGQQRVYRNVAVQGPVTYTALRGARNPRYQPLAHNAWGAFED